MTLPIGAAAASETKLTITCNNRRYVRIKSQRLPILGTRTIYSGLKALELQSLTTPRPLAPQLP